MDRFYLIWIIMLALLGLDGCHRHDDYPSRPITLVCPWSTGGGTDRVSRHVAMHLESELGVPVSVVNAVGGKGVTGHRRGMTAKPDGYTILMATLELNMLHWSGLTKLQHNDCIPIMSLNEDYAAIFVRRDSPWHTLADLEAAIRREPGKLKASGTTSGAAWHLALAGWLLKMGVRADDVVWVSSANSSQSLQELIGGGLDMVCCSLPEARSNAEQLRTLGVMAPQRVRGFDDVPTLREQGTDWDFGGWRGLVVPLGTPREIIDRLITAAELVVTGQTSLAGRTFPDYMRSEGFDNTWRKGEAFGTFLADTDQKFGRLLTNEAMRSVNQDRFHPMLYPWILIALTLGLLIAVVIAVVRQGRRHPEHAELSRSTMTGRRNFGLSVLAVVGFLLLAEPLGFILSASLVLVGLLLAFQVRVLTGFLVAGITVPLVYHGFAVILRVPLPRGILGW
jgi:tripartite-type tricarboxylate transporter receptor subunit TctC